MRILLTKSKSLAGCAACLLIIFVIPQALAAASLHEKPALVSLQVVPDSTTLSGAEVTQQFIVLGDYSDGLQRDLTSEARFSLSDSKKGEISRSGRFKVQSSGEVFLTAAVGGRVAKATIRIEAAEKPRRVTFAREIE